MVFIISLGNTTNSKKSNMVYTKGLTLSNILSLVDVRKKSVNGLCDTIAIQNKEI